MIRLSEAVQAGGCFDTGFPRIAIARPTRRCWVRVMSPAPQWGLLFSDDERADNRGALVGAHSVRVIVPGPNEWHGYPWKAETPVPLVPPQHRPRRPRLSRFHVLWEVEAWEPVVPRTRPCCATFEAICGRCWRPGT